MRPFVPFPEGLSTGSLPLHVQLGELDGSCAESIDKADVTESPYLFYRDELGFRITRAEDRVGVARLPDRVPSDMVAGETTHRGCVERLSRDNEGRTAEYSRTWFDPVNVRFVAR